MTEKREQELVEFILRGALELQAAAEKQFGKTTDVSVLASGKTFPEYATHCVRIETTFPRPKRRKVKR